MSLEDKKNVIILACRGNVAKEPSKITNADLAETLKEGEYNIAQSTDSSDNNQMVVMGMIEGSSTGYENYEPVEHDKSEEYTQNSSLPFIILDTIKKLNPGITDEEAKVEAEKVFERMKAKRVRDGKKRHEAVKYIEKTKRIEVEKAKKDEKGNNN